MDAVTGWFYKKRCQEKKLSREHSAFAAGPALNPLRPASRCAFSLTHLTGSFARRQNPFFTASRTAGTIQPLGTARYSDRSKGKIRIGARKTDNCVLIDRSKRQLILILSRFMRRFQARLSRCRVFRSGIRLLPSRLLKFESGV